MKWGEPQSDISRVQVRADARMIDALKVLEEGGVGIAFVVDDDQRVVGSLTDGDIRREVLQGAGLEDRRVAEAMNRRFAAVGPNVGRAEVLDLMRARSVGQLPVIDEEGRLCGLHTMAEMFHQVERPNRALILAGGFGTRLRPLTNRVPKPMVSVAGRPILERLVLHLMSHGIRHIYLSVHYMAEVIEEHFGDGSDLGCHIEYIREPEPLGTGGCISLLEKPPQQPFLVLNGDLITQADIHKLLSFHTERGVAVTFGVRAHEVKIPYGVVSVEDDLVVDLEEKPAHRMLINAGIYVVSPEVIPLLPQGEAFPITDLYPICQSSGLEVGAHLVEDDWIDIGRPEELKRANGRA